MNLSLEVKLVTSAVLDADLEIENSMNLAVNRPRRTSSASPETSISCPARPDGRRLVAAMFADVMTLERLYGLGRLCDLTLEKDLGFRRDALASMIGRAARLSPAECDAGSPAGSRPFTGSSNSTTPPR